MLPRYFANARLELAPSGSSVTQLECTLKSLSCDQICPCALLDAGLYATTLQAIEPFIKSFLQCTILILYSLQPARYQRSASLPTFVRPCSTSTQPSEHLLGPQTASQVVQRQRGACSRLRSESVPALLDANHFSTHGPVCSLRASLLESASPRTKAWKYVSAQLF